MKEYVYNEIKHHKDIDKTIEERLQVVRDSFGPNKCQCMTALARDLITWAIDVKIKEYVLLHDFGARHSQVERKESKDIVEGNIRIYKELKKQIEALPICEDM